MKVGIKRIGNANKLRAALLVALVGVGSPIVAQGGEPITRLGRTFGVGWGDGYHACADSGLRLLADLPPRSFVATQRKGNHRLLGGMAHHHAGATIYDCFDTNCGSCCDCQCDSSGCDGAPEMMIDGSQVIHGQQIPINHPTAISEFPSAAPSDVATSSPVSDSKEPDQRSGSNSKAPVPHLSLPVPNLADLPNLSVPNLSSEPVPETSVDEASSAGDEMTTFASNPKALLPAKQYPLGPEPDDDANLDATDSPMSPSAIEIDSNAPEESTAVSANQSEESTVVASNFGNKKPDSTTEIVTQQIVRAVPTSTPVAIHLIHTDGLLETSPQSPMEDSSTQSAPSVSGAGDASSFAATTDRTKSSDPPALRAEAKSTSSSAALAVTSTQPAAIPSKPRPIRLGSLSSEEGEASSSENSKRSAQDADSVVVHVNPFAVRPTVELAKRPTSSSQGVIYQPSSSATTTSR